MAEPAGPLGTRDWHRKKWELAKLALSYPMVPSASYQAAGGCLPCSWILQPPEQWAPSAPTLYKPPSLGYPISNRKQTDTAPAREFFGSACSCQLKCYWIRIFSSGMWALGMEDLGLVSLPNPDVGWRRALEQQGAGPETWLQVWSMCWDLIRPSPVMCGKGFLGIRVRYWNSWGLVYAGMCLQ